MGLRIVHIGESLLPQFGGTAAALRNTANMLAARGTEVTVLLPDSGDVLSELRLDGGVRRVTCTPWGPRRLGFSYDLKRRIAEVGKPDLIHLHGLWRLYCRQGWQYAVQNKIPTILSTHGMLAPAALSQKKWRKSVARWLFQDRLLNRVDCLHTTSAAEAHRVQAMGFKPPVAVIPLAVDVDAWAKADATPATADFGGKRLVLLMSRFHPHKGIDLLLQAWRLIEGEFKDWTLGLFGYDEDGYRNRMQRLAAKCDIADRVVFGGPVQGEEKRRLMARAEVFILPSRSESFGLVIPEALAAGVPVITTTRTPWECIARQACGWYVEPTPAAIATALRQAMSQPAAALREMGRRGSALIAENYSPHAIGNALVQTYAWMIDNEARPSFVLQEGDNAPCAYRPPSSPGVDVERLDATNDAATALAMPRTGRR